MTATDEPVLVTGTGSAGSARVAEAHMRADERLRRQRGALRPVGLALILAVVASSAGGHPPPAVHGKGAGVTLALCLFAAAVEGTIRDRFVRISLTLQVTVIGVMGAAAVALVALQPRSATALAGGAAVWMAVARLPLTLGVALAAAIALGLDLAGALAGASTAGILATTLLCTLLAVVAHFMKQARESQERAEVLLAQLEDARDEQARAAAIAERGRIAGELHDVLAHSLSGAAIQLQGARMLAEREQVQPQIRAAIERASALVRDGLGSARQAVSALRGEELPGVGRLQELVEGYRRDLNVDAALRVEGAIRALPAEASLALYRGAQEALTNVARYAPGAPTAVVLQYDVARTTLSVTNGARAPSAAGAPLRGVSGGHGLEAMRERIERVGGNMRVGASGEGWRVELEVPV